VFSDEVYFPSQDGWFVALGRSDGQFFEFEIEDDAAASFASIIRHGFAGNDVGEFRDWAQSLEPELLDALAPTEVGQAPPSVTWPTPTGPGIYRREHAALLIRSETTTILFDPVARTRFWRMDTAPINRTEDRPDAIVITHSHGDHFHVPSILACMPDADLPVVVPEVPRANLLTWPRFEDALRAVEQNVVVLPWYASHVVGDITIDALPFFGEQPTRDGPGPSAGLRNFGNCYRITTPQFSCLVLVDSGADPDGSMEDVIQKNVDAKGPVDVVLSCLREFACPFFGGLDHYWSVLSLRRLRELYDLHRKNRLPSTTAGPELVASLCKRAGARYYLPYANGYQGVGVEITDIGWGSGESAEDVAVERVAEALRRNGAPTSAMQWLTGGSASFEDRRMRIRPPVRVPSS
jgi:L-ascorbate metabolism protein UlaG (beta-lactamase superfamily)